ncbi:MAG TPA: argininosuccinate lyase, partial [bacterium]|nr:argininosuccinate lyase [bacterium]
MRLWGGRFKEAPDENMLRFTSSLSFDRVLASQDLSVNRAWSAMLNHIGILTAEEWKKTAKALERIREELEKGQFIFGDEEDVHSSIERRLRELLGDLSGKLASGRSRNDLVVTDLRLYLREKVQYLIGLIKGVNRQILEKAQMEKEKIMPGFTHLQPAMPVTVAHYLLSFFWMFIRDIKRLKSSSEEINQMPLGSAALAGSSLPIDREFLAKELGFSRIIPNSMDAVSDRDFLLQYLFSLNLVYLHLSRFSEDMILFSSPAFGFIEIEERFMTGSSLMPQKKNPDFLELIRGKAARSIGTLTGLLGVLKGLPLTYNRDLQEDKKDVFFVTEELSSALTLFPQLISGISFREKRMMEVCGEGFVQATLLAEYLVKKGIEFRKSHHIIGNVIVYCQGKGMRFDKITLEELQTFSPLFTADVLPLLRVEQNIEAL